MIRINTQFSLSGRLRINLRYVFISFDTDIIVRYNIMDRKTYKSCKNAFNMNKSFYADDIKSDIGVHLQKPHICPLCK